MQTKEPYTKQITCPEHPQGGHTATLYLFGHKYAGIWECPENGVSDACAHENTHVEDNMYVCDLCDCVVDGDPQADAAEAKADIDSDNWRDE